MPFAQNLTSRYQHELCLSLKMPILCQNFLFLKDKGKKKLNFTLLISQQELQDGETLFLILY
jgi:hypothetical protein